jgi:ketosteroid isomerase-like protein
MTLTIPVRPAALLAGLIAIAHPSLASAQDGARTADVTALVARYDSAWNRRDTTAVSRLLAAGYQYFSSRGDVSSRAETMRFLADPHYLLKEARRSELTVTLSGSVAVVSSRWQGRGSYRGERFVDDQRCGQVWQQSAGRWRMLSEHCVQIAPPAAAPSG